MYPLFSQRKWGDPVRVKASFSSHSKRVDGHVVPEYRRFSLDPQLTNFETLYSLISRAFDIKSDFLMQYRFEDPSGQEIFLQLLSDWDLEAAFERAADPCLCLRIDPIPLEHVEEWDLVNTPSSDCKVIHPKEGRNDSSIQTKIMTKVGKTINLMQQALNLNGSCGEFALGTSTSPLTDTEFTDFRDGVGTLIKIDECKQRIFQGGLEPSLRRVVWKHLLNVYPDGLNGSERMKYMGRKSDEYQRLKSEWMIYYRSKKMSEELQHVTSMVRKDVLRTDRQHPFYSGGDDNANVEKLFNILTTYAIMHPTTGYCQGMSDMASPILFVMDNEAHSYIAFTALMERLKENFSITGTTMTLKFDHLCCAIAYHDPVFFAYLQRHNAIDLLFCYRWLLLEMKREFAFDEALRMLEVTWSSLPKSSRQTELALFERIPDLAPTASVPIPLPARIKESPYTKVCSLRRQSSSPASSFSFNSSEGPVGLHSALKNSRDSQSICSPSWDRGNIELDDVFIPANDKDNSTQLESLVVPHDLKPKDYTESHRDLAQSNGRGQFVVNEATNGQQCPLMASGDSVSSALSSLMKVKEPEEKRVDISNEGLSCPLEDSVLQDFEVVGSCEEAIEAAAATTMITPSNTIHPNYVRTGVRPSLPSPDVLGCGNPFLIFLCLTVLLQHRDSIINRGLDSNEMAMHFDRLVRKHDVERVLSQARTLYYRYLAHFNSQNS
ncbi:TBC1 domain family member 25-like [Daphnia carinata]|uniref:TBC1 domain family member 25-like n=1 Tax=Daphnia carinata TaxID=120202 RepID=UPI00257D2EB0|nr:TBC1 domain family member 25-like [Daphnia carinata]